MTADDRIWIGQDGQKYGPYSEDDVRQWMQEGRLAADALAWREGMDDWVPLASLFVTVASGSPPPPPAGMPPLAGGSSWTNNGVKPAPFGSNDDVARATLPAPPSLAWGLVLLFSILTLGIFGLVWPFIQAHWVRKIDRKSNARLLLGLSLACFLIGEPLYLTGFFYDLHTGQMGNTGLISLGGMLLLGRWILGLIAYFSMADSVKRCLAAHGAKLEIGGVTLFFFTMLYLQANLSWVVRWKNTGQISPKPSKAAFWAIFFLFPLVLGILAAIAIPVYQNYVTRSQLGEVRAQVTQGFAAADDARKAMARYYENHHAFPPDNAAAGLADNTSMAGRYVSSVNVAGGAVIVSFDTTGANRSIRQQTLVLLPVVSNNKINWNCSTYSTVPGEDLPESCQK